MHEYGSETLTEISYLVLLSLYHPNHGYGIMRFLEEHTDGRVQPGAGTLYGAINQLEKKGWISLISQENRRKTYQVTGEGKRILQQETQRLKENYLLGETILKETIERGAKYGKAGI